MPLMWLGMIFAPFFVWIYAQDSTSRRTPSASVARPDARHRAVGHELVHLVRCCRFPTLALLVSAGAVVYIAAGMAVHAYPAQATRQPKTKVKRRR
jgi:hypothetical protein